VSSAQRFATTVPQQALFMMNSPFTQEQARRLMQRAEITGAASEAGKIAALYRVLFQRAPEAEEVRLAQAFLKRPVTPAESRPMISAGWQYGYGTFDAAANRVRNFQAMATRRDGRVSPETKFPDPKFGHLSLTATGGHPGKSEEFGSVRRWTAPAPGTVRIEATLGHASATGDGVRARIVASEHGKLGEWSAHDSKVETKLESVSVEAGEFIDFIVDPIANSNSDAYTWSPVIAFMPHSDVVDVAARTWNAKKDFDQPVRVAEPLTRWEELAQVLLLSNELAFVD
jgi:hypothetical protein